MSTSCASSSCTSTASKPPRVQTREELMIEIFGEIIDESTYSRSSLIPCMCMHSHASSVLAYFHPRRRRIVVIAAHQRACHHPPASQLPSTEQWHCVDQAGFAATPSILTTCPRHSSKHIRSLPMHSRTIKRIPRMMTTATTMRMFLHRPTTTPVSIKRSKL